MESKKLREERAALVDEMNFITTKVAEENREFSAEETEKFDRLDAAQEDLSKQIDKLERVEKVHALRGDLKKLLKSVNFITTSRPARKTGPPARMSTQL